MSRHGKTMGAALAVAITGLIILMSAAGHGAGKKARRGGTPPPPPPPPVRVTLPPVETHTADNGLRLYYIKDELPQITIVVSIGYGKLNENKDNAGISELLARTLTLAGSKKYPGEKLSAAIERVGGRFSIQESWENTLITIRVLERHSGLAYDILGDLVKNPNFDVSYLNQARSLMDERIRRRRDNPAELAFVMLRKIIFSGDGYGAVAVERSVASITLNDLAEVWKTRVKARNIMVGIAGSPEYDAVRESILNTLGDLEPGLEAGYAVDRPKALAAVSGSRKKIYFIPRPIPQATIVVGTVAPDIRSPHVYSLQVMDYILGGGSFNSRLMKEIRVKRGLAYAVQSVVRFRRETGVFMAFAQTGNDQAHRSLSLMLENISRMATEQVSEEEMRWAKNAIINSYIFDFETPLEVLGRYLDTAYYGLPSTYLSSYTERIGAVSREETMKSAGELLNHGLVCLVVGGEDVKKNLSALGEIVVLRPD